jgi:hypothetical protein
MIFLWRDGMKKMWNGICGWGKGLSMIALCLPLAIITFYGCAEKKEGQPAQAVNPMCELVDKLPGDLAKPVEVSFGGKVKLLGFAVEKPSKSQLKVSYYWRLVEDLGLSNMVFVHFVDADDKILFQGDHDFCQKRSFAELKGKLVKETQVINVPESALGKEVGIKIGLFAPTPPNYERLKIVSVTGAGKDNDDTRAILEKLRL